MPRSAFVIPGQGGYLPGVLAKLTGYHVVQDTLDAVDKAAAKLGRQHISGFLTSPNAAKIDDLAVSDPAALHLAIYATGIAATRLLIEHYGINPDLIIGHSFGEITALAAAGVFTVEDGAYVAAQRDEALSRFATTPGGMVALNTNHRRAYHLIGAVDAWNLAIAADNAPDQVVVSGPHDQLDQLTTAAEALGITATRLRVHYPFHNRLLAAAAQDFSQRIAEVPRRDPRIRIYSPLLSRYIDSTTEVDTLVVGHLTAPARFLDAVRTVHDDGVTRFIESGAKSVCTDFINGIVVGVDTIAPLRTKVDAAGLQAAVQRIQNGTMPASAVALPPAAGPLVPEQTAPRLTLVSGLDLDSVLNTARDSFADTLGYPPEAFQPDSDLESDLGIDSLKQIEVFGKILEHYGLAMPDPPPRLTSYTTLSAIAKLITEIQGQQAA